MLLTLSLLIWKREITLLKSNVMCFKEDNICEKHFVDSKLLNNG